MYCIPPSVPPHPSPPLPSPRCILPCFISHLSHLFRYGFVQFSSYFDASKALVGVNGTEVKGRRVTVDWLLPKTEYQNKQGGSAEGVEEGEKGGSDEEEVRDEGGSDEEGSDEEEGGDREGEEEEGGWGDAESEDGGSGEDEIGSSDGEEEEGESEGGRVSKLGLQVAGANGVTDDVSEGRTIFIRLVVSTKHQYFGHFGVDRSRDSGCKNLPRYCIPLSPSPAETCHTPESLLSPSPAGTSPMMLIGLPSRSD